MKTGTIASAVVLVLSFCCILAMTSSVDADIPKSGACGDGLSVMYPVIGILAAVFVGMLVMDIFRRKTDDTRSCIRTPDRV